MTIDVVKNYDRSRIVIYDPYQYIEVLCPSKCVMI